METTSNKWGSKGRLIRLFATLASYIKKGGFHKFGNDMSTLRHFVSDILHRRYKDYSLTTILLSVAAIVYIIFPLDFIPDLLPFFGAIDDLTIFTWAMSCLGDELRKYRDSTSQPAIEEQIKEQ